MRNKVLVAVILLLAWFSGSAAAQEAQEGEPVGLSGLIYSEALAQALELQEPSATVIIEKKDPERGKIFWVYAGILQASAEYDMYTTFKGLEHCYNTTANCVEGFGLSRGMIEWGNGAYRLYLTGTNVLNMYIADKVRKSNTKFAKFWWTMPVGISILHVVAGLHNQFTVLNRGVAH